MVKLKGIEKMMNQPDSVSESEPKNVEAVPDVNSSCCCCKPSCCDSRPVKSISSKWSTKDYLGAILVRLSNYARSNYKVEPGLYSLGKPGTDSPVFVSAHYKLSFDILRRSLFGIDAWILVLDTKGINVWCAAGKGSFCSSEIAKQVTESGLSSRISHHTLILPQLGASGVSAPKLKKLTGFTIKFGPVRAADIPAYLDNNLTATPQMRRVQFSFIDRTKLIPMEVFPALKKVAIFLFIAAILFGITRSGIIFRQALVGISPLIMFGLTAVFTGSILTPLLLPFLHGRAFSVKGFVTGIIGAIAVIFLIPAYRTDLFLTAFCIVAIPLLSSYQAFLFTGCTTYTSPTGVKAELKIAWPLYCAGACISVALFVIILIRFWGLL
jgi:acetyl-CoA decarbonylase/synthase complex subunit gamma